jgi:hypothetical protein
VVVFTRRRGLFAVPRGMLCEAMVANIATRGALAQERDAEEGS